MQNQGYRPPQPGTQYNPQGQWYAPPPQTAARRAAKPTKARYGGGTGGGQRPPRKKRSVKWQLVKLLLVLVLLGGAGVGGYIWKTQSDIRPYLSVFAPNVTVDGIELSGKTWAEGSRLVWDQVNQKQNSWYVRLKDESGRYNDITAEMLGISFDPTEALAQAWAVGHDVDANDRKDIFRLKEEIEEARASSYSYSSAQQSADTTLIDDILQTLQNNAYRAPSDAYIISFNPDDSSNPFTYQYETYGQRLDTTEIRAQILDYVNKLESGEVLLKLDRILPNVTVEQLSQTVALRFRAVTAISSSSTEDRTENIRIAFGKINGMVLADGQSFSFNSVVGRRSLENGYLPAIEYAYGSEQWGIGGGVCQASTTVYLAAIQSGMTILKREPHSMSVSYTELGKDATVSDTRGREIDFSFRNNTGSPVYIAAHVVASSTNKRKLNCEVRIYGPSLGDISYALESATVETISKPEPVMKQDTDATYVTYVDETKTIKGRDGYKVEAYLITYQNGVEISRETVSTDTYPARADTIYVGVTPRWEGV